MRNVSQARALLPRQADLASCFSAVSEMTCLSIIGVSNLGKSALLRAMTDPLVQTRHLGNKAPNYIFIYVDFNRMLEMSEQAFCELVLRCSIDTLRAASRSEPPPGSAASPAADGEVLQRVEQAYAGLVAPSNSFEIPLRFSQGMAAIGDLLPEKVVFLLDELDEAVAGIDGRVFLNLRALKDKHLRGLSYITATNRRLTQIRPDTDVGEFAELFAHHVLYIQPLDEAEIRDFAARFAASEDVTFADEDVAFIRAWAGGHPGLLEAVCRALGYLTGRPQRDPTQNWIIHRRAAEILPHDLNVQVECRKIWNDLTPGEQEALLSLPLQDVRQPATAGGPAREMDSVMAKHLAIQAGSERRIFSRAFEEFVQLQQVARQTDGQGVNMDPDSGEVWVDGKLVPTLTNLEYRLLLLLYGRLDKICSKYDVVEAVWGEDYIEEVDDARIEKLVSRLRQKIEPDPNNPRYLLTIRGRGYRLNSV